MQHDGNTLGDVIKEKKRSFRELSGKERVRFIWDYYRVQILLGLFFIFVAGSLLYHYVFEVRDTLLYGITLNTYSPDTFNDDLSGAYMTFSGADQKQYEVIIESNLFMGSDENIDADMDYGTVMKVSSLIAAQQLDFVICNTSAFENYEAVAGYYDLQELLPADLYAQLDAEGRIVFGQATNAESATRMDEYAMAIDITDTDFVQTYGLSAYGGGPIYLSVITNTQRTDEAVNLIRFVFGQDYVPSESPAEGE